MNQSHVVFDLLQKLPPGFFYQGRIIQLVLDKLPILSTGHVFAKFIWKVEYIDKDHNLVLVREQGNDLHQVLVNTYLSLKKLLDLNKEIQVKLEDINIGGI